MIYEHGRSSEPSIGLDGNRLGINQIVEAQQLYNITEIIILVLITAIGTGAFL